MATFKDLRDRVAESGSEFKHVFFTGSNLTSGKSEIFSHLHTPDMVISDVVRISMSIPFLFTPRCYYVREMEEKKKDLIEIIGLAVHLRNDRSNITTTLTAKRVKHPDKQNSLYVDGGMGMNYPIRLFDVKYFVEPKVEVNYINTETLGFRLVSSKLKSNYDNSFQECADQSDVATKDVNFLTFLTMIWNFYYLREENKHSERGQDKQRSIYIDSLDVNAIDFSLNPERKRELVE